MKKLLLAGLATLGFTFGAEATANIEIDNQSYSNYGLAINTPQNYFGGGAFSLEVWYRNTGSIAGNINNQPNPLIAHNNLLAGGYTLAATYHGTSDQDSAGIFSFGTLILPLTPGSAVIALAAWNSSAASWAAATNGGATHGGVITLVNQTGDQDAWPFPDIPPNLGNGWNNIGQDLVMVEFAPPIPEPGTMALAGLGAATLLAIRRRR